MSSDLTVQYTGTCAILICQGILDKITYPAEHVPSIIGVKVYPLSNQLLTKRSFND